MVDPQSHWSSKAEELKKAGKFEEAVEILDKVQKLKKEEKADDFWYKKAIQYCDLGEYEQAKDALYKDLEINPKNYDTFFLLGKIFYELKKYEDSLEYFNKASEELSRQHLQNTHKFKQMKKAEKFEEAVKYSDLAYREKMLDYEYWYHKGMTLFKLGKFNEASSCFKISLSTKQENPKILYELAKSELCAGDKQKSLEILEKCCLRDPLNKEKLRIDKDFELIAGDKRFQIILGLLSLE